MKMTATMKLVEGFYWRKTTEEVSLLKRQFPKAVVLTAPLRILLKALHLSNW